MGTPATSSPATLDDLMKVDGKAELIGGRIVHFMPSGHLPCVAAVEILVSLRTHSRQTGVGQIYGDGMGYAIRPPLPSGRQSFSPDVSYYVGPLPANLMRFVEGPPTFAVEVSSENDYGPAAERDLADKRADYFRAGTQVVWDVDPVAETVTRYQASAPTQGVVFRRGDIADAEPAVPGWRIAVDEVFAG